MAESGSVRAYINWRGKEQPPADGGRRETRRETAEAGGTTSDRPTPVIGEAKSNRRRERDEMRAKAERLFIHSLGWAAYTMDSSSQTSITHQQLVVTPGGTKYWILEFVESAKPYNGQRFQELHEAVDFYKRYALIVGSDVRHNTLIKSRDKTILWKCMTKWVESYLTRIVTGHMIQPDIVLND
ncbi:Far-red impaired responsive (FAR1) family protein [Striga asiatica]|uniref:Far-red impaired responsive (FAR1) family protein n=1 Tax=Striga asiatica TaxID=4170 RepID=A0A5A7PB79_STRAF|nr:Far-red impaired responsive (FAR1) family protein [Striga asiatica]